MNVTLPLLIEASGSPQALASFVGAVVFTAVGLIALSTGVYGGSARPILKSMSIRDDVRVLREIARGRAS